MGWGPSFHQHKTLTANATTWHSKMILPTWIDFQMVNKSNCMSRSGSSNQVLSWTTLRMSLSSRARNIISRGPQQECCHGHELHSSMRVAVETLMEGTVLLELAAVELELFEPAGLEELSLHSLVWCRQKRLCFLHHQCSFPSLTMD